ncbi:hypothetical protein MKW98_000443 [Papaver atlanticum]|uniref:Uncharacterized protein n=1 Tax=Papaver atlanticum TaxID=357466 RepID=A0AAD4X8X6_9MAGN|nr:hypothetical protein MKW98_000443 [Papaver atlanticum]
MLEAISLDPSTEDQLIWLEDKKGSFSVKAAYKKTITSDKRSVSSYGRLILVVFQLWIICTRETMLLINLFSASFVMALRKRQTTSLLVVNLFTLPDIVQGLFSSWKNTHVSDRGKFLWRRLPATIIWGIWKARNAVAFSNKLFREPDVIRDIKIDCFHWAKGKICFHGMDTTNILSNWLSFFL